MVAKTEITCKCGCGRKKMVRTADVKRGWGLYYSKSCKAKHQTKTTGVKGPRGGKSKIPKSKRVQYLKDAYLEGDISEEYYIAVMESEYPTFMDAEDIHIAAMNDAPFGSEDEHGQWMD